MTVDDWTAFGAVGQWVGGLATAAAVYIALRAEQRARSTKIEVNVAHGSMKVRTGPAAFVVAIRNKSGRTVTLESAGIELPDGRHLGSIAAAEFVGEMRDLERREHRFAVTTVADWLSGAGVSRATILWFYIQDATGKQHWCKYRFDPTPYRTRPTIPPSGGQEPS